MDTLKFWRDKYNFMRERGDYAIERAILAELANLDLITYLQYLKKTLNNPNILVDPDQISILLMMVNPSPKGEK
jgi:hypothetical protein